MTVDSEKHTDDLISRQAAIDALKQQAKEMSTWIDLYHDQWKGVLTSVNIIADLPSAEPERKTGKWEDNYPIVVEFECLRCDNCHGLAPKKPYCCFCGAKMEAQNDE